MGVETDELRWCRRCRLLKRQQARDNLRKNPSTHVGHPCLHGAARFSTRVPFRPGAVLFRPCAGQSTAVCGPSQIDLARTSSGSIPQLKPSAVRNCRSICRDLAVMPGTRPSKSRPCRADHLPLQGRPAWRRTPGFGRCCGVGSNWRPTASDQAQASGISIVWGAGRVGWLRLYQGRGEGRAARPRGTVQGPVDPFLGPRHFGWKRPHLGVCSVAHKPAVIGTL
jgi:hypothetical protein